MTEGSKLDDVMSEGSIEEDPVEVEMMVFSISVGSLDVDETVVGELVAIVAAVVIVAPTSVVVAWPRVIGFLAVSQIVKLYVPHPALMEPVPQIVWFANPHDATKVL